MIDTDKYEGHTLEYGMNSARLLEHLDTEPNRRLIADAPLILAAYDKQVRWINDILFRLEKMDEATTSQRLRFLLTVQEELKELIE